MALALSGGIDSAILAKYMPKDSIAYTFKCVVPGIDVVDESDIAARYAEACGLKHKVIEVYWEDFENLLDPLMIKKGSPIHSIEVQIYKAALAAKQDGIHTLILGEAADAIYGGQSNILSRDWKMGDFIERYSYILPYKIPRDFCIPIDVMRKWEKNGIVDPYKFMSHEYIKESVGSYLNACSAANINCKLPYAETFYAGDIDYKRIRSGENKYIVREVFSSLYPSFDIPAKIPMPRPMNEWLCDWRGPARKEFWDNCAEGLSGDQKWLVWCLERYLNLQ